MNGDPCPFQSPGSASRWRDPALLEMQARARANREAEAEVRPPFALPRDRRGWASVVITAVHTLLFVAYIRDDWVRMAAERYAQQLLAACDSLEDAMGMTITRTSL